MPENSPNQKFIVPLGDGRQVEAVAYGSGTLCLSTQVGCALGCPFCASGRLGLQRNLTLAELHAQLAAARRRNCTVERLTLSGIGEPLHNAAVVRAFIADCRSARLPVSLTTTGSPPEQLRQALSWPHNGLMLSLHAGTEATHRRLVPHGPDWNALWAVLAESLPTLSRRQRRRVGINYLLLAGENDQDAEFAALVARLRPWPELTVHLLVCNPVAGSGMRSPAPERIDAIHALLRDCGINVRRANRWRIQAEGGCGTLVAAAGLAMEPGTILC